MTLDICTICCRWPTQTTNLRMFIGKTLTLRGKMGGAYGPGPRNLALVKFWLKIEILVNNRNFRQKSEFWSKIELLSKKLFFVENFQL